VVGLFVGRPVWRHLLDKSSTLWTVALKCAFGFGIGVGLYALVAKAWGGFELSLLNETRLLQHWQFVFGGAIGALYGAFVEIDDAAPKAAAKEEAAGARPSAR
jgi:hypothetical protein